MKIKVESVDLPEPEVIIRGDVSSAEVIGLLQLLGKRNSGKLLVCREEEQCILDAQEIVFLEVREGKVYAMTRADSYETRLKLYEVMEQLSGRSFVQVNKSVIVNMNCVKSIQAEFSGNYRLKLKNRPEVLTLSRKYFKAFKDSI